MRVYYWKIFIVFEFWNYSDICGVVVDGVEGEFVNFMEVVVEVIGVVFVVWFFDKKNVDFFMKFRVLFGIDLRVFVKLI